VEEQENLGFLEGVTGVRKGVVGWGGTWSVKLRHLDTTMFFVKVWLWAQGCCCRTQWSDGDGWWVVGNEWQKVTSLFLLFFIVTQMDLKN